MGGPLFLQIPFDMRDIADHMLTILTSLESEAFAIAKAHSMDKASAEDLELSNVLLEVVQLQQLLLRIQSHWPQCTDQDSFLACSKDDSMVLKAIIQTAPAHSAPITLVYVPAGNEARAGAAPRGKECQLAEQCCAQVTPVCRPTTVRVRSVQEAFEPRVQGSTGSVRPTKGCAVRGTRSFGRPAQRAALCVFIAINSSDRQHAGSPASLPGSSCGNSEQVHTNQSSISWLSITFHATSTASPQPYQHHTLYHSAASRGPPQQHTAHHHSITLDAITAAHFTASPVQAPSCSSIP
eukprot:1159548-Pelagomonas_calceolata.AAC.7